MIQLTDISKHYAMAGNEVSVLRNLHLSVDKRESVAIIGPSGSGKSTLLLILTGLEQASSGSVVINNQSLEKLSADERADLRCEHIGIVFQSFHLIPSLSARENVALPLDISGIGNSGARALEQLERVGLADRADHYPSQLSGGEQQRVAIARSMIHKPDLIVADEPTGNLDAATGTSIMQLLFDVNRSSGTTLLLVTHDPNLAAQCDRTLRLHDGTLVQVTPSEHDS